ncbi:DUF4434 domain-containing protein [Proteiniphilum sp. X52]|uniref:DUF4434 domain-containing protein n=1 Tax=Proteiniphilum sp. X52 TaxID=2382159 RepID=UPI0021016B72|nr:DUF4434 domain-containing protein [Proteiniphilum sp. X52]
MMKKIYLLMVALSPLLLSGCGDDDAENQTQPLTSLSSSEYITVDAQRALTGSFVTFWDKGDWTQYQWNGLFEGMRKIGMNIVIIQFTAYEQNAWYDTSNTFSTNIFKFALTRLLNAAELKGMEVYIGLYFHNEYWSNQTNADWLRLHADRCISVAREIYQRYGTSTAFKGWYLPHEPEPYAYHSTELLASFRDNFVNRVSDSLHQLCDKPVAIAAFWNSNLTSPIQLQHFMAELGRCNLQVIMLQDGVGVGHVSLDRLEDYYQSAAIGLYEENTNYQGEFWTDMETFESSGEPAGIDRIKQQLAIELAVQHISRAVSYLYEENMCPTGPYGAAALKLRNNYTSFITSGYQ